MENGDRSQNSKFCLSEMIATKEEMDAAQLELKERDFCAHKLITLKKCRSETIPPLMWLYCPHEIHDYEVCQAEE